MAVVEVSEEWQVDCPELKKRALCLYETRQWADCSFRFKGETDAEDGILKAHSLMLAMASPVFAAQFYGQVADKPEFVDVQDIKIDIFAKMLRYIYTDGIEMTNVQTAIDLYYAAKKYFLHFLKKECIDYLQHQLNPGNVCRIYEFCCFYEESGLRQQCLKMIGEKTVDVLRSSRFGEAKLDTIEKIMSMEALNINGEVDLLCALLNYARKRNMEAHQDLLASYTSTSSISETDKSADTSGASPSKKKKKRCYERIDIDSETSSSESSSSSSSSSGTESDSEEERKKSAVEQLKKKLSEIKSICKNQRKSMCTTRKMLRNCVKKIRFLTMTPKQFAECRLLDSLLKKDEIIAISMNIASPISHIDMPRGFSKCRVPRNKKYRAIAPGGIRFTVKNIYEKKRYSTETFVVGDVPWKVRVELCACRRNPNNPPESNYYLRIHIDCLLVASHGGGFTCKTAYAIKSHKTTASSAINLKGEFNFSNKANTISHTRPWKLVVVNNQVHLNPDVTLEVSLAPQERVFTNN